MLAPIIAVVHSGRLFLTLMHELLADKGYRVLPLCLADAAAALRRESPALVILDFWADVRHDGWGLLLHLRADLLTTDLPAILFAEDAKFVQRMTIPMAAIGCTVLAKPFGVNDLLRAITERLGPSPMTLATTSSGAMQSAIPRTHAESYQDRVKRIAAVRQRQATSGSG